MTFLYFFVPVVAWVIIARTMFSHLFSFKEIAAQIGLSFGVLGLLFLISFSAQTSGRKLISGAVTETLPLKKSCPSGWVSYTDEHCTEYVTRSVKVGTSCSRNSEGKRTCHDVYETQYNYVFPWERRYYVKSDIGDVFEISRVDRQGSAYPPRFSSVRVGDPVTAYRSYTNYVRAAAGTLFRNADVSPVSAQYPKVYDYYHANRVIYDGSGEPPVDTTDWNRTTEDLNRDVRSTGANVIYVVTDQTSSYSERLAKTWDGNNINDVVVVIGVQAGGDRIEWVDVRSWAAKSIVNVEISDAVRKIGVLSPDAINSAVSEIVKSSYAEQSPEAFSYLADDIPIPTVTLIIAFLLLLVATPMLTMFFVRRVSW